MDEYRGESSITIRAPVEQVYAYLVDFTKHPQWAKNLSKVTQITPGPIAVGTTFKTAEGPPPVKPQQKLKMMMNFMLGVAGGAKTFSRATICALDAPTHIAWYAGIPKGEGYFNIAEWEFVLEPQGNTTHLTQRFAWKPQNRTARRMVSAAGVAGLEEAVAVSLGELKRRLETGSKQN